MKMQDKFPRNAINIKQSLTKTIVFFIIVEECQSSFQL